MLHLILPEFMILGSGESDPGKIQKTLSHMDAVKFLSSSQF